MVVKRATCWVVAPPARRAVAWGHETRTLGERAWSGLRQNPEERLRKGQTLF